MAGRVQFPDGTFGSPEELAAQQNLDAIRARGGSQSELDEAGNKLGSAANADYLNNGSGGVTAEDQAKAAAVTYNNPPAADVGGYAGGAKDIHDFFRSGEKSNDAAQASNNEAMGLSLSRMREDRAPLTENATLVGREAASRQQQLDATGLMGQAAMGNAPSAATAKMGMGLNDSMAGQAGASGAARGLSALNGVQGGASGVGMQATNSMMSGGMARGAEVNEAMGAYGGQAGDVRSGDLGRVNQTNQNSLNGQSINDNWKVGNADLAASQGGLGASMRQTDDQYFGASQEPAKRQLGYDQEMNAIAAGQSTQEAAARRAKSQEGEDHARQLAGGAITTGLTIGGGMAGGPAGAAAGGFGGGIVNSYINKR